MITNNEIEQAKLSACKKDFYQIWNELLDLSSKISERWDPTSTNESDPGIVLLKVLTGVADKLNYNIDKNILECFMPSAAQQQSMRKLCEMMGHNIKYYQSATTSVTISYVGDDATTKLGTSFEIPKFTSITNSDNTINYVTTKSCMLTKTQLSTSVDCIEGELETCETDNDNIISLSMLDDNNRYYLPESTIAENGIFVQNVSDSSYTDWEKVENLNTQSNGSPVYKFGFDSLESLPYIQFPEDISSLIGDGLIIKYIRTNGVNGNISAKELTTLNQWSDDEDVTDFFAQNPSAAKNGANPQTNTQAYNSFKKTIGTFDTLVTCRDYMNKIYQLYEDNQNIPLVSNCIVSDIRDDINRAITICSFDDYGIKYVDKPIYIADIKSLESTDDFTNFTKGKAVGLYYVFVNESDKFYKLSVTTSSTTAPVYTSEIIPEEEVVAITNFDLVLYPFKTVYGLNSKDEFKNSFTYNTSNVVDIISDLEDYKTISHNYVIPGESTTDRLSASNQIVAIKNYLQLNAKITTTSKVNSAEAKVIIANMKTALYESFNMRQVDFGDEIPYDSIYDCIKAADEKIKNVSLEEPTLYTAFTDINGEDYVVKDIIDKTALSTTEELQTAKFYNKLALRNILAGRIDLFDYNEDFTPRLCESKYTAYTDQTTSHAYEPVYPDTSIEIVSKLNSTCLINIPATGLDEKLKLSDNEVISFRAPNFKTTVTYPAYVNYYAHLPSLVATGVNAAHPATMQTFYEYFNSRTTTLKNITTSMFTEETASSTSTLTYTISGTTATKDSTATHASGHYEIKFDGDTFIIWNNWIKTQLENGVILSGIYRRYTQDSTRPVGKYVDAACYKYLDATSFSTSESAYYVQLTHGSDSDPEYDDTTSTYNYTNAYTADGLGRDAVLPYIPADSEYALKTGDFLCINYTESSSSSDSSTTTSSGAVINKKYTSSDGIIIRPNFELKHSPTVKANGTSYSKTTGYDSTWNINGMFSLGTNDQIELRERVQTPIWESTTSGDTTSRLYYIYWKLNSKTYTNESNKVEKFPFDSNNKYVLQDGEYFFYTDENKLDMAYYGSGTEIEKTGSADITRNAEDDDVSLSEILSDGISAIPWNKINLSNTFNITFNEYQYINLTKDDALYSLKLSESETSIDNTWKTIDSSVDVNYKLSDSDTTSKLPTINVSNCNWQVRSRLEYNIGPNLVQKLNKRLSENNTWTVTDKIVVTKTNTTTEATSTVNLQAGTTSSSESTIVPLYIKSNYLIQSSLSEQATTWVIEDEEEEEKTVIDDFKIKLFKSSGNIEYTSGGSTSDIEENNSNNNYWTSFQLNNLASSGDNDKLKLQTFIPSTANYGMIMIFYTTTEETVSNYTYLKYNLDDTTASDKLKIYNNVVGTSSSGAIVYNESWWSGYTSSDKYFLKPGINVIRIPKSGSIDVYKGAGSSCDNDIIVFSTLDIIKVTNSNDGINLDRLNYFNTTIDSDSTTTSTQTFALRAKQLLTDIRKIDLNKNFYYNTHIDNSLALNLNYSLTGDDYESLISQRTWYDYNNVNNKFVISEISADDLSNGIIIEKTSKLNY